MSDESLKATITAAMKAAMKARDKERLGTIRLIQSEFKRIEVDERIEIDDARALAGICLWCGSEGGAVVGGVGDGRDAKRDDTERGTQELASMQVFVVHEVAPVC
jgi:hypothetical protein